VEDVPYHIERDPQHPTICHVIMVEREVVYSGDRDACKKWIEAERRAKHKLDGAIGLPRAIGAAPKS
jgi:hypothetical protein